MDGHTRGTCMLLLVAKIQKVKAIHNSEASETFLEMVASSGKDTKSESNSQP
jgi:hypothetical protein